MSSDQLSKSTPISQLKQSDTNNDTVQKILKNYESLENNHPPTYENEDTENMNEEQYEYRMDETQYGGHRKAELDRSTQYNGSNKQLNNKINELENVEIIKQSSKNYKSYFESFKDYIKGFVTVSLIVFLLCMPFFDKTMINLIAKCGTEYGDLTYMGILTKAVFAGVLFSCLKYFINI